MSRLILFFLPALLLLTGCSQPVMDKPAADGNYHYRNYDFSFQAVLPPEFEYYQTQRRAGEKWTDIEFFIPSNDPEYPMDEFPNYWKPLVVRVWDKEAHAATLVPGAQPAFASFGSKRAYVHTYRFEKQIPDDWKERWTPEIENFIIGKLRVK